MNQLLNHINLFAYHRFVHHINWLLLFFLIMKPQAKHTSEHFKKQKDISCSEGEESVDCPSWSINKLMMISRGKILQSNLNDLLSRISIS